MKLSTHQQLAVKEGQDLAVVVPLHRVTDNSRSAALALASFGHTAKDIALFFHVDIKAVEELYKEQLETGRIRLLYRLKDKMVDRALGDSSQAQKAAEYLLDSLDPVFNKSKDGPAININTAGVPSGQRPVIQINVVPQGQFYERLPDAEIINQ